jgi:alkylation response protein AidB-like acyl-CoA dehydrogenase
MFCLVRTDIAAVRPQLGLTMLMVDMSTPGITVRPIVTIDRRHETNEVFFDNVRVPVKNRIADENKGWSYAKYLLSHERLKMARVGLAKQQIARAKELSEQIVAGDAPIALDARFRERVAALEVELKALEMTAMRVLAAEMATPDPEPDPASSLLKMKGCELLQAATELMMQLAGPAAVPYYDDAALERNEPLPPNAEWAASVAPVYFFYRVFSISGGSNEIQRNIIAKTMLGM